MNALRSDLFGGDQALWGALTLDSAHLLEGAVGGHVEKIQNALMLLLPNPPCKIADSELSARRYGRTTADAVLRYKIENQIINRAYQSLPDNIVGKMTMRALEDAMVKLEAELAASVLCILTHLDQFLLRNQLMLSPMVRVRFEKVRAIALALAAPAGGLRPPGPRLDPVYRETIEFMDRMVRYQPPIVFAAAAVVVLGAVLIFIAAVAAVIAIQAMRGFDPFRNARKVGSRVNVLLTDAIEAGEQAIVEDVRVVDALTQAVDSCRRRSQNPSPECQDALNRFDAKKRDLVAKRNEFQKIIQQLNDARDGDPKKIIWKLWMQHAEKIAREFNALEWKLLEIAKEIIKACGCQFIKIPEKTPPLVIFDL